MPETITCAAELTVDQPQAAALRLFTPEGERAWAPGWNPAFPAPQRTEGRGAVFITGDGEDATTWVMVDQDERLVRYARFAPGATAGTVAVAVLDAEAARTRVRVSYDLTALGADGARWLEDFAAGFNRYIAHWEKAIAAATSSGDSPRRAAPVDE
jgi:hypothetical protein